MGVHYVTASWVPYLKSWGGHFHDCRLALRLVYYFYVAVKLPCNFRVGVLRRKGPDWRSNQGPHLVKSLGITTSRTGAAG